MNGADHVQRKWDVEIKLHLAEAQKAAEENQKLIVALEETKNANLKTVSALRRQLSAVRVSMPTPACGGLDAPSGSKDGTPGTGPLPKSPQAALDDFTAGLAELQLEADTVVEECRVVRDWAAKVKKPG